MIYRQDNEFEDKSIELKDPIRTLLLRWRRNCLRSQIANYDAANWFSKANYWIGIPATFLAAGVATSMFATLQTQLSTWAKISFGLLSALAALLAALQTFLRLEDRSNKHRASAGKYGSVKREIDLLLAKTQSDQSISEVDVESIRKRMDSLAKDAPEMPERFWQGVHQKVPPRAEEDHSLASLAEDNKLKEQP